MTRLHVLALATTALLLLGLILSVAYWLFGPGSAPEVVGTGLAGTLAVAKVARAQLVDRSTSLVDTMEPVDRARAQREDEAAVLEADKKTLDELLGDWREG